jgi:hypothetical protein
MARFIRIGEQVLNLDQMIACQPITNELGLATGVHLVFPLPLGILDLYGHQAEALFEEIVARAAPEDVAAGAGVDVVEPVLVQSASADAPRPAGAAAGPVPLEYRGPTPRG